MVRYKGHAYKWDTVIEQKVNELGRCLAMKASALDFADPAPKLERHDHMVLRAKILGLTSSEAQQLGIGKSTLHYLRKNAQNSRSFKAYHKVKEKLAITILQQLEADAT
jgi:hypothetical protein